MQLPRLSNQLLRFNAQRTLSLVRCAHQQSTVDADDVKRHSKIAPNWWDPKGPVRPLHTLNEIRIPFIRDGILSTQEITQKHARTPKPLQNIRILEVGCGAGILTEAMARLHAHIVAIDPGQDVINVAKEHLKTYDTIDSTLAERITYKCESIEQHMTENVKETYDAVVVSEVLEHVHEKQVFLELCVKALKPGGSIFITTFNKTFLSWLGGIVIAEHILELIPKGTHEWDKFISPVDTQRMLDQLDCSTIIVNGFILDFWKCEWRWTQNQRISYALQAIKN